MSKWGGHGHDLPGGGSSHHLHPTSQVIQISGHHERFLLNFHSKAHRVSVGLIENRHTRIVNHSHTRTVNHSPSRVPPYYLSQHPNNVSSNTIVKPLNIILMNLFESSGIFEKTVNVVTGVCVCLCVFVSARMIVIISVCLC